MLDERAPLASPEFRIFLAELDKRWEQEMDAHTIGVPSSTRRVDEDSRIYGLRRQSGAATAL
jgi:hypothetical protein